MVNYNLFNSNINYFNFCTQKNHNNDNDVIIDPDDSSCKYDKDGDVIMEIINDSYNYDMDGDIIMDPVDDSNYDMDDDIIMKSVNDSNVIRTTNGYKNLKTKVRFYI